MQGLRQFSRAKLLDNFTNWFGGKVKDNSTTRSSALCTGTLRVAREFFWNFCEPVTLRLIELIAREGLRARTGFGASGGP